MTYLSNLCGKLWLWVSCDSHIYRQIYKFIRFFCSAGSNWCHDLEKIHIICRNSLLWFILRRLDYVMTSSGSTLICGFCFANIRHRLLILFNINPNRFSLGSLSSIMSSWENPADQTFHRSIIVLRSDKLKLNITSFMYEAAESCLTVFYLLHELVSVIEWNAKVFVKWLAICDYLRQRR